MSTMSVVNRVVSNNSYLAWWVLLVVWMLWVNPNTVPGWGLIVPFICMAGGIYTGAKRLIRLLPFGSTLSNLHVKTLSAVTASILVTVVGLQSIGQLTIRDVITVGLLTTVGYFYLYRNVFKA